MLEKYTSTNTILREIESLNFDFNEYVELPQNERRFVIPDNIEDKICLCYAILKRFAERKMSVLSNQFLLSFKHQYERINYLGQTFVVPFAYYIFEQIEDNSSVLYMLNRYKHRAQWFFRKELLNLYLNDTSKGEDNLTRDLHLFLFDQGIEYPFSTPLSSKGRVDLVGNLHTKDPLVLEVKLFRKESGYDKAYIRKGLVQAYNYAQDYNKRVGYLLVYNLDDIWIEFENNSKNEKMIRVEDKVIYIIVVNLNFEDVSASNQRQVNTYVIEDDYLKEFLHDAEDF